MKRLEKNSAVPLYYQLYSLLLKDIQDGVLKPGEMIPPESSLMETYDISRATVRHAILDLAREGYVDRKKSKGTIVKDTSYSFGYQRTKSFAALSQALGSVELSNKVLEASVAVPPSEVRQALQLSDNEKTFYLRRVRSIDDKPCVYVEDWVDYKQCSGIECVDFNRASLFNTLENIFGKKLARMVRSFECCQATTEEQLAEMKIRKNKALLKCTNTVYDNNDIPTVFSIALINGKYTVNG